MNLPGQYLLPIALAVGAAVLSAGQAWALGGAPPRLGRYALVWVAGTAGLALPVLLLFAASGRELPLALTRIVLVLAALTSGFALWIGARVGAPTGQGSSFVERMWRLLPLQVFVLALLGALDGCALLLVGLGRVH